MSIRKLFVGMWCLFFAGCASSPQVESAEELEYTPLKYAKGFKIYKSVSYTKLVVFLSDKDSSVTLVSNHHLTDTDFQVVNSPIRQVACLTTTAIPFLDKLESIDAINAMAYLNFVKNERIKAKESEHELVDLGSGEIDVEQLIASQSKVLVANRRVSISDEQLKRFNITPIYMTEYNENHPLAKAEWIKFFGVLLNKENEAGKIFNEIERKYELTVDKIRGEKKTPVVLFGYEYQGRWSAPGGDSYIKQFISDAGGVYFNHSDPSKGAIYMDKEELIARSQEAEIWLMVGQFSNELTRQKLRDENALNAELINRVNGRVFICNTLKNNYFEDAILEPDVLLNDISAAIYPDLFEGHEAVYFKRLTP